MNKAELKERLNVLSKELDQDFPTSGTNDELRERIVTAEEMLALKNPDDSDANPDPDPVSTEQNDGDTFIIRAKSKAGFYRCGKFWPFEGRTVQADQLSDTEIKRLKAERNLIVE